MLRILNRALIVIFFVYLTAVGATFNGVILPDYKPFTFGLMAVLSALWLASRWRRGWRWHRTSLDAPLLLWLLAFGLSLLFNQPSWRRIAIGFWYVAMYIGVWYVLHDALANRGLGRQLLVDALLITGIIVILIGYWQVALLLPTGIDGLPRPVSLLGNTNALGAFILVLLPFIVGRMVNARFRFQRIVLGLYALLALALLFLTFSRGAWLGFVAATLVGGALLLASRDKFSRDAPRLWWRGQSRASKMLWALGGLMGAAFALVALLIFVSSFSIGGRSLDLRLPIYESALRQFAARPLVGHGLFTFGQGLMGDWSMPPNQPHSHAHSVPLGIAAELGLVGLLALAVTLGAFVIQVTRNWRIAKKGERTMLAAASAAIVGFGVHHLVDWPAMMPLVALTGLLALGLAVAPVEPKAVTVPRWGQGRTVALAILWALLIISGLWSTNIYNRYLATLRYVIDTGNYAEAARRLDSVIEADPALALYHMEQAFLYGMAANEDDRYIDEALAAYDRFLELEPNHAVSWANRAALYWQAGDNVAAVTAIERAVRLAPEASVFARNLQRYSEDGDGIVPRGEGGLDVPDYDYGVSFPRFQYLRETLKRQFLPQVAR